MRLHYKDCSFVGGCEAQIGCFLGNSYIIVWVSEWFLLILILLLSFYNIFVIFKDDQSKSIEYMFFLPKSHSLYACISR